MGKGSGACLGKSKPPAAKPAEKKPEAKKAEEPAAAPATTTEAAAPAASEPAAATEETKKEETAAAPAEETKAAEETAAAPADETKAAEEPATSTTTPAGEPVTVEQPAQKDAAAEVAAGSAAAAAVIAGEGGKKAKVLVVYYSMYGHIRQMAEKAVEGIKEVDDVDVEIYQVPETLPQEVLDLMHAPPKGDHPVLTFEIIDKLAEADGILFGFPTRFGMMCAQMKAFFDTTGGLWAKGALAGKLGGVFCSTATQNGGQESTAFTAVSQMAHHGMLFVPVGYTLGGALYSNEEVRGGSVYGAGMIASSDGSRQPSALELDHVKHQGQLFANTVKKFVS